MNRSLISAAVLLISLPLLAIAQQPAAEPSDAKSIEKKKEEAELRKEVALLLIKETGSEIEMLRSLTNRIAFSSDLADAAYSLDPEMSKRLYLGLADSLSRFITTSSSQLGEDDLKDADPYGYRDASLAVWRLRRASMVRRQAVVSAAKHDPLIAMGLFESTRFEPRVRKILGYSGGDDNSLLAQLVTDAALDDPETVEQLGDRLIKEGLNGGAIALLSRLAEKDLEAARKYAPKVIAAGFREIDRVEPDMMSLTLLLRIVSEKQDGDGKSVIDRSEAARFTEAFGRLILDLDPEEVGGGYGAMGYVKMIRTHAPGVANRISKKFGVDALEDESASTDADIPEQLAESVSETSQGSDGSEGTTDEEKAGIEAANKQKRIERLENTIRSSEDEAEREAAINELVSVGMNELSQIRDPLVKIAGYAALAERLEQLGQLEAASELLDEASRAVTANPRNYEEFLQVWALAGALVKSRPDRAFAMVEDLVFRLNDVIATLYRFSEFMDTRGEIIDEGELQFGGFGGGMMTRFGSVLNSSENNVKKFAEADLGRTRAMAERFDRSEIRVAAKLLVLKSYLEEKSKNKSDDSSPVVIREGETR